jgi:hypothetical protein
MLGQTVPTVVGVQARHDTFQGNAIQILLTHILFRLPSCLHLTQFYAAGTESLRAPGQRNASF